MSNILTVSALGDALGAPYEFNATLKNGDYPKFLKYSFEKAGSWTDDTSMALCIAYGLLADDMDHNKRLDLVAKLFYRWADEDGAGIGMQTSKLLGMMNAEDVNSTDMMSVSKSLYERSPDNSAGNGSLMRIHPVAIPDMSREDAAVFARDVTLLTHTDPRCVDSSVLWVEMLRVAKERGIVDPYAGMDLIDPDAHDYWNGVISEALELPSVEFSTRGWWVVPAFQQALSAVLAHRRGFPDSAPEAFREIIGATNGDTDTIACIAGGLMGALGVKPKDYWPADVRKVYGSWPKKMTLAELAELEQNLAAKSL